MAKIRVDVSSSHPLFIEVDPDDFGEVFASMGDDDQVAVLRAMVSHMSPHRMQWDHISIALEAPENRDVRDQLREVLFPQPCLAINCHEQLVKALEDVAASKMPGESRAIAIKALRGLHSAMGA